MKTLYSFVFFLIFFSSEAQPFYRIAKLPVNQQVGLRFTDASNAFWWGSSPRGLLLRTTNKGLTWDSLVLPGYTQVWNAEVVAGSFFNKDTGLVGAYNNNSNSSGTKGIYKTYDGGNNWVLKSPYNMYLSKISSKANLVYAFTGVFDYLEIFKSIDHGENWTTISYTIPISDYGAFQILDAYINSSGDFIGVTDGGKILKYIASSGVWQIQYNNSNLAFNKVFFFNDQVGYAAAYSKNPCFQTPNSPPPLCGYLFKTINGGATWDTLPRMYDQINVINAISPDTVYFACGDKIYLSYDGGTTRQILQNTNFQNEVSDIVIRNKKIEYVFLSGNSESELFYKYPVDSLMDVGYFQAKGEDHEIVIFPNPSFNGFKLKTASCKSCDISAQLFNVNGSVVGTYALQRKTNLVDYDYLLETQNLSPGIYFLRLKIDEKSYSFKLIKSED